LIHLHPICEALIILISIPSLPNLSVQLDDWVLCRIYKRASHAPPMAVPPLSDHELQDEPCGGFDENPYAATSAAMLLQGASYPALHAASAGAQRMPRIPSFSELFNDPSLLAHFFEEGGMQPDMARLGNQQQQHAPLLGRPVTSQLLVNSGSSMSPGQIQQMDPPASTSAAGDGAAGNKRKRSSETSTASASALSSQQKASACSQETEGLLFWCNDDVPNRQRAAGVVAGPPDAASFF